MKIVMSLVIALMVIASLASPSLAQQKTAGKGKPGGRMASPVCNCAPGQKCGPRCAPHVSAGATVTANVRANVTIDGSVLVSLNARINDLSSRVVALSATVENYNTALNLVTSKVDALNANVAKADINITNDITSNPTITNIQQQVQTLRDYLHSVTIVEYRDGKKPIIPVLPPTKGGKQEQVQQN